jgi:hypothetical protein
MDYGVVQGSDGKSLLPIEGTMTAVDGARKVYSNRVAFSHCHVFAAESRLSTGTGVMAAVLTRYKQNLELLPANLTLPVALTEPIVAKNARVGDLVTARLESAVQFSREHKIPAGSLLTGRIRQFARLDDPPNSYLVGLAFSELEGIERSYRFFAELFGMEPLPGVQSKIFRSRDVIVPLGTNAMGRMNTTTGETISSNAIPGTATFFLTGGTPSLPRGFRMTWRTVKVQ